MSKVTPVPGGHQGSPRWAPWLWVPCVGSCPEPPAPVLGSAVVWERFCFATFLALPRSVWFCLQCPNFVSVFFFLK